MATTVAHHLAQLKPDDWRQQVGFSPQVEAANRNLFESGASEAGSIRILSDWLQAHQWRTQCQGVLYWLAQWSFPTAHWRSAPKGN
jgi:hypothetical protein